MSILGLRRIIICIIAVALIVSTGCESFRKKFIRQKKTEREEEMVISPKDYSQQLLPSDKAYTQYYVYWKAWHQELMKFANAEASKKKLLSCFEQVLLNLDRMKGLLVTEEKIAKLNDYIAQAQALQNRAAEPTFQMISVYRIENQVSLLYRSIQRDFSLSKVKGDLK